MWIHRCGRLRKGCPVTSSVILGATIFKVFLVVCRDNKVSKSKFHSYSKNKHLLCSEACFAKEKGTSSTLGDMFKAVPILPPSPLIECWDHPKYWRKHQEDEWRWPWTPYFTSQFRSSPDVANIIHLGLHTAEDMLYGQLQFFACLAQRNPANSLGFSPMHQLLWSFLRHESVT